MSEPLPPSTVSDPTNPRMVSSPSPARIVSLPAPPVRVSAKALPVSDEALTLVEQVDDDGARRRGGRYGLDADDLAIGRAVQIGRRARQLQRICAAPTVDAIGTKKPDDEVVARTRIDDIGAGTSRYRIRVATAGDREAIRLAAEIEHDVRRRRGERDRFHVDDLLVDCAVYMNRGSRQAERVRAGRAIERIAVAQPVEGVVALAAGQRVREGASGYREALALVGEIDRDRRGREAQP